MGKLAKKQRFWLALAVVLCVAFVVFTLIVALVDVDRVGLSHVNQFFWQHCGKNVVWERITDWLGYLVILAMISVVVWQIVQWVLRKSLRRIDSNLLLLDLMFGCLVVIYLFFEIVVINYRPELEHGVAKASYPSSHTMLFMTVLPLLVWQVWHYVKNKPLCVVLTGVLSILLVIGVVGRLLSGVHWFTDIVAGIMVGGCLDSWYLALAKRK
ncbi:MAG: phosphatase PAP2 family protein [Clostridia bacterium]|nr:phosphatase PAP2 family protein [Clostridia bacterium]